MSALLRSFKNIWSHGDDEEYAHEETDTADAHDTPDQSPPSYGSGSGGTSANSYRSDKYSDKYTSSAGYSPSYGGGSGGSNSAPARRLKPVATPLRAREKNIYTLKPTNLDEASIAADYLKTGSAVVLNLEAVDRVNSMRIIDFMSGVCYGLEGQGHAMKLGETIFLFTPTDFEISSDETDYGENRDYFFKDVTPLVPPTATGTPAADAQVASAQAGMSHGGATHSSATHGSTAQGSMTSASSYNSRQSSERRSWER